MEEQPKAIVKTLRHEFSREIKRQYCFFFLFSTFFLMICKACYTFFCVVKHEIQHLKLYGLYGRDAVGLYEILMPRQRRPMHQRQVCALMPGQRTNVFCRCSVDRNDTLPKYETTNH